MDQIPFALFSHLNATEDSADILRGQLNDLNIFQLVLLFRRMRSIRLKLLFSRQKYPDKLVNSSITRFIALKASDQPASSPSDTDGSDLVRVRVVLPFKDQDSADVLRGQLKDLSQKIRRTIQPVFVSHKIEQELKLRETKPPVVKQ